MERGILPIGEQKRLPRAVDMKLGPSNGVSTGRGMAFQEDRTAMSLGLALWSPGGSL